MEIGEMKISIDGLDLLTEWLTEAWIVALTVGAPLYSAWVINHWPVL
jgi:hypothetical protein